MGKRSYHGLVVDAFRLAIGFLLGVVGLAVLVAAARFGLSFVHSQDQDHLQYTGHPPRNALYALSGQHFSGDIRVNMPEPSQPMWIRYSSCPVTKGGALRVTWYKVSGQKKPRVQVSNTLVDYHASDAVEYTFWTSHPEPFYVMHVDIPGQQATGRTGCGEWRVGEPGH